MQETQKDSQRLLSRPGPDFITQKSHGAKKPTEKGVLLLVRAKTDHIKTMKNQYI